MEYSDYLALLSELCQLFDQISHVEQQKIDAVQGHALDELNEAMKREQPRTVRSRYLRGSHGGTQGQRYERFPAFPAAHGRPYVRQDLALRRDDRRVSHEELEWIGEGRERFWRTAPLFPKPASVVCAPSPSRYFDRREGPTTEIPLDAGEK